MQAAAALRAAPGGADGSLRALRDQPSAQRSACGRRPFLLQRRTPSARRWLRTVMAGPAVLSLSWLSQEGAVAVSLRVSLQYFHFYRIAEVAILLPSAPSFRDALHPCS